MFKNRNWEYENSTEGLTVAYRDESTLGKTLRLIKGAMKDVQVWWNTPKYLKNLCNLDIDREGGLNLFEQDKRSPTNYRCGGDTLVFSTRGDGKVSEGTYGYIYTSTVKSDKYSSGYFGKSVIKMPKGGKAKLVSFHEEVKFVLKLFCNNRSSFIRLYLPKVFFVGSILHAPSDRNPNPSSVPFVVMEKLDGDLYELYRLANGAADIITAIVNDEGIMEEELSDTKERKKVLSCYSLMWLRHVALKEPQGFGFLERVVTRIRLAIFRAALLELCPVLGKLQDQFKFEHRDLHMGNVMFRGVFPGCQFLLIDFGMSKMAVEGGTIFGESNGMYHEDKGQLFLNRDHDLLLFTTSFISAFKEDHERVQRKRRRTSSRRRTSKGSAKRSASTNANGTSTNTGARGPVYRYLPLYLQIIDVKFQKIHRANTHHHQTYTNTIKKIFPMTRPENLRNAAFVWFNTSEYHD
jgi:hypothetical protein